MTANPSVLCVGHVNWDVVLHSDAIPNPDCSTELINAPYAKAGGSATNTAIGLASLGVRTSLAGSVGGDEYGQEVLGTLAETGVTSRCFVDEDAPTTLAYALTTTNSDPRYLLQYGTVADFTVADIDDDVWADIDHVHVTTFSKSVASEFAQTAAADGKTVSFNPTQGYANEAFPDIVDAADVIIMNDETEEPAFRERYDLAEVVADDTCVVITHGGDGSTAHTPHGAFHHEGFDVSAVTDTIGAGDSFVAGFLSVWGATSGMNVDYERALATGNACGACAVQSVGAPLDLGEAKQLAP